MSLTGVVYCDDVERGRLKVPHPIPALLFIDETGCPSLASDNAEQLLLHDRWEAQHPCPHEHFWLVERLLGSVSAIGMIRELVQRVSRDPSLEYPVLWSKVIYDGSHSGDFLKTEEVVQLKNELDRLRRVRDISRQDEAELNSFLSTLEELILASLGVNKPISF